jgi:hypothetical protein
MHCSQRCVRRETHPSPQPNPWLAPQIVQHDDRKLNHKASHIKLQPPCRSPTSLCHSVPMGSRLDSQPDSRPIRLPRPPKERSKVCRPRKKYHDSLARLCLSFRMPNELSDSPSIRRLTSCKEFSAATGFWVQPLPVRLALIMSRMQHEWLRECLLVQEEET